MLSYYFQKLLIKNKKKKKKHFYPLWFGNCDNATFTWSYLTVYKYLLLIVTLNEDLSYLNEFIQAAQKNMLLI